ncbi:hypothetical protein BDN72DRAFT_962872 [Pluteus cervinus]|uniref:Uncharacterized protein n=1 Tax=Pluteus cervinus TaxID=181527 RepID=A0ACD3AHB7_9AGAR|nr:hypothetical protein BDN72DRAFT_962872 [Pluteus cervinus]
MPFDIHKPRFGPEIERIIFTQAAYESVYMASKLVVISKRVQEWIEPILYRVILLDERLCWPPLKRLAQVAVPDIIEVLEEHGKHVRHLSVFDIYGWNTDSIIRFLELCPNVVDLAIWCRDTCPRILEVAGRMKLQRLSALVTGFGRYTFTPPRQTFWRGRQVDGDDSSEDDELDVAPTRTKVNLRAWQYSLTHLELINGWLPPQKHFSSFLFGLKALSHVSMRMDIRSDAVTSEVLRQCQALKVLAFVDSMNGFEEARDRVCICGRDDEDEDEQVEGDDNVDTTEFERTAAGDPLTLEARLWDLNNVRVVDTRHRSRDPRVLTMAIRYSEDWLKAALGGDDTWVIANCVIEERRREALEGWKVEARSGVKTPKAGPSTHKPVRPDGTRRKIKRSDSSQSVMTFDVQKSRFGHEIERLIFTHAACASVYTASRLVLVAKRVQAWVEPILYRIVAVHEDLTWPPIKSLDLDASSPETIVDTLKKYGKHVHHLLLGDTPTFHAGVLLECLKLCPNVVDLLLLTFTTDLDMIKVCSRMKLKKLSISLNCCLGGIDWDTIPGRKRDDDEDQDTEEEEVQEKGDTTTSKGKGKVDITLWKSTLTHLDILDDAIQWEEWAHVFLTFKNVTYLSLHAEDLEDDEELRSGLLHGCKKLKGLAFAHSMRKYEEELAEENGGGDDSDDDDSGGDGESEDDEADSKAKKGQLGQPDPTQLEEELFKKKTVHVVDSLYRNDDPRLLAVFCEFLEDWLKAALGGTDLWAMADELVEKERERQEKEKVLKAKREAALAAAKAKRDAASANKPTSNAQPANNGKKGKKGKKSKGG